MVNPISASQGWNPQLNATTARTLYRPVMDSLRDASSATSASSAIAPTALQMFKVFVEADASVVSADMCKTAFDALPEADQNAIRRQIWVAAGSPRRAGDFGRGITDNVAEMRGELMRNALAALMPAAASSTTEAASTATTEEASSTTEAVSTATTEAASSTTEVASSTTEVASSTTEAVSTATTEASEKRGFFSSVASYVVKFFNSISSAIQNFVSFVKGLLFGSSTPATTDVASTTESAATSENVDLKAMQGFKEIFSSGDETAVKNYFANVLSSAMQEAVKFAIYVADGSRSADVNFGGNCIETTPKAELVGKAIEQVLNDLTAMPASTSEASA